MSNTWALHPTWQGHLWHVRQTGRRVRPARNEGLEARVKKVVMLRWVRRKPFQPALYLPLSLPRPLLSLHGLPPLFLLFTLFSLLSTRRRLSPL